MASQTQASQSDVDDQRFAELLKPIKDLTSNWEVPLADLLSTYIDDLQHVTITFDGGETSVNFAQAALVIQGTASVYSKKVEFLWQMVLQTLEMLRSKKEEEEGAGGDGDGQTQKGSKKKNQVDMTREFGLLEADLGKNIDVKNEDESLAERKNALNFIYITPRQLIEKEGSEQKAVKVNLFMGVLSGKFDILAAKEDFRINSQYVSVTGGLGEDLTVDNRYLSVSVDDYNDDSMIYEDPSEAPPPLSPHCPPHEPEMFAPPSPLPDGGGDQSIADISHTSIRAVGQHNDSQDGMECVASLPPTPPPCREATPEPVFDPWEPLDPYQVLSTPKPLKKGKTIRLPPSLREKQPKKSKQLPPIEQYLVQEMTNSLYNPAMLPNVAPVFYDLASTEIMRRRELQKEEERMNRLAKNPAARRDLFFDQNGEDNRRDDNGVDLFDGLGNNDEDVEHCDDIQPVNFSDDDLPNPHLGGEVGSFVMDDLDPIDNDDDFGGEGDSYEDLVAKRVAEFVQKSQDFLKSSELTRRVAKWHEMIGPRLDKVEQRKAFDVHAYGSHVLNTFPSTATSSNKRPVDFAEVVRGKKGEEVARFFLSTLMLANTENVKISTKAGSDPQLGMDNVQLTLLSHTRHHEQLAEFEAASQADPGSVQERVEEPVVSTNHAVEGPYQAKKRNKKSKNDSFDEDALEGSDSEEEQFKIPKRPVKKKGKKGK